MSRKELKDIISDCCNDVVFDYNGRKSGVTSEVKNHIPTFQVWHGSKVKEYDNVDDVMNLSKRFKKASELGAFILNCMPLSILPILLVNANRDNNTNN